MKTYENKETNKFKGLCYYAISSKNEVIAEGSNPENVYFNAINKGEFHPIVISSNTIIKTIIK
jgi:hypothetical protein